MKSQTENTSKTEMRRVTHYGKVHFGDVECEAVVLDDGTRGYTTESFKCWWFSTNKESLLSSQMINDAAVLAEYNGNSIAILLVEEASALIAMDSLKITPYNIAKSLHLTNTVRALIAIGLESLIDERIFGDISDLIKKNSNINHRLTSEKDKIQQAIDKLKKDLASCRSSRRRNALPTADTVYFISNGTHIKIGKTWNVTARIKALQTASSNKLTLLGIVPISEYPEEQLHKKFSHLNSSGEWFFPEDELLQFIAETTSLPNESAVVECLSDE